jgi:hypothetical protein
MKYPKVGSKYCHDLDSEYPDWYILLGYSPLTWHEASSLYKSGMLVKYLSPQPGEGDGWVAYCIPEVKGPRDLLHTSLPSLLESTIIHVEDTILSKLLKGD